MAEEINQIIIVIIMQQDMTRRLFSIEKMTYKFLYVEVNQQDTCKTEQVIINLNMIDQITMTEKRDLEAPIDTKEEDVAGKVEVWA